MSTEQIAVRVPTELLRKLDALVEEGIYPSRAEALRRGIEIVTRLEQRRAVDREIVDGYERLPQTDAEERAALTSLREAIAEEPW